jgi:uncharacterized damage-inducible protein DinB
MPQQTTTEKDSFLQAFQQEVQITTRLLKAFPADKGNFRPHDRSRTANELTWTFVGEQAIAAQALQGKIDFAAAKPAPPTAFTDTVAAFEKAARDTITTVTKATDTQLNAMVKFPVGPGKTADMRAIDVLWATVRDQIHHRGQMSVYVRLAGGKVPSIYGPTADEPWM